MNRKHFILNLIIILAISLAAGFFISTKVYHDQWQDMMFKIEEVLEDKRFNLVDELVPEDGLSENMIFNFNSQVFLVAQKKDIASPDILLQTYFDDDFLASAVVITNDGWLITASFLEDYDDLVVITNEREIIPVQEIVSDPVLNLSYLKIDKGGLNPVAIINSGNLKIGQNVYAVRPNYYNYQHEIIDNSIRNLHARFLEKRTDLVYGAQDFSYGLLNNYMEGDLALFNSKSQLIGFSDNQEGKTYLIPSKYIIYSFTSLFRGDKKIVYPSLDIRYIDLSELVLDNDLPSQGAHIYEVLDRASSFKKGDIITHVENDEINEIRSLNDILLDYQINDEINVTLLRQGQEMKIKVIIQPLESLIR